MVPAAAFQPFWPAQETQPFSGAEAGVAVARNLAPTGVWRSAAMVTYQSHVVQPVLVREMPSRQATAMELDLGGAVPFSADPDPATDSESEYNPKSRRSNGLITSHLKEDEADAEDCADLRGEMDAPLASDEPQEEESTAERGHSLTAAFGERQGEVFDAPLSTSEKEEESERTTEELPAFQVTEVSQEDTEREPEDDAEVSAKVSQEDLVSRASTGGSLEEASSVQEESPDLTADRQKSVESTSTESSQPEGISYAVAGCTPTYNWPYTVKELLQWRYVVQGVEKGLGGLSYKRMQSTSTGGSMHWKEAKEAIRNARAMGKEMVQKKPTRERRARPTGPEVRQVQSRALQISDNSWVAQQERAREEEAQGEDRLQIRTVRSVLNKLTPEKFEPLVNKLLSCGIKEEEHVEILMCEVFEKATTQHHFIDMYADLCERLHLWFLETQVCGGEGKLFRRVLLARCQMSFEEAIRPRAVPKDMDPEQYEEAELRHKMRMLGNMRLIGALLRKGMIAKKIILEVLRELTEEVTARKLECLAVVLTAVGSTLDKPECQHAQFFGRILRKVEDFIQESSLEPRIRCLLQDVLDLRATGWHNMKKAVRAEAGPTTLKDLHLKVRAEAVGATAASAPPTPQAGRSTRSSFGAPLPPRGRYSTGEIASPMSVPQPVQLERATTAPANLRSLKMTEVQHSEPKMRVTMDEALDTLRRLLRELASGTSDLVGATSQLKALKMPEDDQAHLIARLLTQGAEAGKASSRQEAFQLLVQLAVSGTWTKVALEKGLAEFGDCLDDLKLDVPNLEKILTEELNPTLKGLEQRGLIKHWHF